MRYADLDSYGLEKVEPVYKSMKGWAENISQATSFNDLPKDAQNYVKMIEEIADVPVKWIGVGPERDATIRR